MKPKKSQEKVERNAFFIRECEVKKRSQSAVWRQWNAMARPKDKITRQRVHAIIARHRRRKRARIEAEKVVADGD